MKHLTSSMTSEEIELALSWQLNWYFMELYRKEPDMALVSVLNRNISYLIKKGG